MSEKQIKFYNRCLVIISIFIFLFIFFFSALSVNASSTQTYFPFLRNQNGTIPQTAIDYVNNNWDSTYYYFLTQYNAHGNSYDNGPIIYCFRVPKTSGVPFASIDDYKFSLYYNGTLTGLQIGYIAYYRNQWNWSSTSGGLSYSWFQNKQSPAYNSAVDYYGNFDLYTADPSLPSSQAVMLMFAQVNVVPGTATQPTTPTQPGNKPQAPTNNTYTWTQTPNITIDNTDVLHLLGSFITVFTSYVVWLCENIEGFFSTLFGNIFAWFQYFANLVNYWADAIWTIIKDFMMNFFDNMASLFEPIANNIKSIVEFCGTGVLGGLFDFLNPDDDVSLPDLFDSIDFSSIVNAINNFSFQDLFDYLDDYVGDFIEPLFDRFNRLISIFNWCYTHGLDNNNEFSLTALGVYLFVPSVNDILTVIQNHDEYHFIAIIEYLVTITGGISSHLNDNNAIYYINIPSFTIMGTTIPASQVDFSWYLDYKVVGDAIISAFLIIGYFYWLWTRLSGWFRGNSGDIFTENNSDSSNYHGTKIGF